MKVRSVVERARGGSRFLPVALVLLALAYAGQRYDFIYFAF